MRKYSFKGYIFILLAVTCWGISGPLAKFLFSRNYDSFLIIQSRATFSFITVLLYILIFNKKLFFIKFKDLKLFFILGIIGMAGSNFFYYTSMKYVTVSTAIMIQYITPFIVLVYSTLHGIEKMHYWKILLLLIAFIALFFAISSGDLGYFSLNIAGVIISVCGALTWAFFNIFSKHIKTRYNNFTEIFYIFGAVTFLWLCVKPSFIIELIHFEFIDFAILYPFAIISILIPMAFYNIGLKYLKATQATVLGLLEPIIVMIVSSLLINELVSLVQAISSIIVLSSIYLLEYFRNKIDHYEN